MTAAGRPGDPCLPTQALPRVLAINVARTGPNRVYPEHTLTHFELNFLSSGRYTITLNRDTARTEEGWVYAYRPGDVVSAISGPGDGTLVCRWVKFTWPGIPSSGVQIQLPRGCALTLEEQRRWAATFDALLEAEVDAATAGKLGSSVRLMELVEMVAAASSRSAGAPRRDRRLAKATAFMDRAFAEPLGIPAIAQACGMSADYFTRLFRRELGLPPMQHLIGVRLAHARRLLITESGLPIAEVARRSGFEDTGHFTRLFRQRFGLPPRAFRMRADPY